MTPLYGFFLDKFGARALVLVGSLLNILSVCLLALASPTFDSYIAGYFLFAGIGGPSSYFAFLTFSQFWPERAATVVSYVSSSFDLSAMVFYIFEVINNSEPWLTSSRFFWIYLTIPLATIVYAVVLWPRSSPAAIAAQKQQEESVQRSAHPTTHVMAISDFDKAYLTCDDSGATPADLVEDPAVAPVLDNNTDNNNNSNSSNNNVGVPTLMKSVSKRVQKLAVDLVANNEKQIESGPSKQKLLRSVKRWNFFVSIHINVCICMIFKECKWKARVCSERIRLERATSNVRSETKT